MAMTLRKAGRGTATAAYQIEGGWNADGKGESIWDRFSSDPANIEDRQPGTVTCDHYHLYTQDLDLMQRLGLKHYRLSFAYGNFATLSNVRPRDIARILEYRLSPLYVSVHATPHEARKVLLNNPKVPDIVEQLTTLAAGGIQFHCQIVVVPGLNDGAVLGQSLTDLWNLGSAVPTVAIVPVGLTQFSHLYTGRSMANVDAGTSCPAVIAMTSRLEVTFDKA